MGYFSNTTENEEWKKHNCYKCIHNDHNMDCMIMLIHFCYQTDQFNNKLIGEILSLLIPKRDIYNLKCAMMKEKNE